MNTLDSFNRLIEVVILLPMVLYAVYYFGREALETLGWIKPSL